MSDSTTASIVHELGKAKGRASNLSMAICALSIAIEERASLARKLPEKAAKGGTVARRARADYEIAQCNLLDYRQRVMEELEAVEFHIVTAMAELDVQPLIAASVE